MTKQEQDAYYAQACQAQTFSPAPPPGYCQVHQVPEPSTLVLLGVALVLLVVLRLIRR